MIENRGQIEEATERVGEFTPDQVQFEERTNPNRIAQQRLNTPNTSTTKDYEGQYFIADAQAPVERAWKRVQALTSRVKQVLANPHLFDNETIQTLQNDLPYLESEEERLFGAFSENPEAELEENLTITPLRQKWMDVLTQKVGIEASLADARGLGILFLRAKSGLLGFQEKLLRKKLENE